MCQTNFDPSAEAAARAALDRDERLFVIYYKTPSGADMSMPSRGYERDADVKWLTDNGCAVISIKRMQGGD